MTPPDPPRDTVGAFVPHGREARAGAGRGPLAGRRFAVKDLFDVEGMVTGGGSPDWLAAHAPAHRTAPAVAALLAAGADFVGKTVCDEFFYSLTGANAHYGTPVNVRAKGRLPGGSSAGSAAAVAAGLCDFALGSDTGGSVRVPAAFCGLFGLRPTHGRIELTDAMAMAPRFDTGGWFAHDVRLFRTVGGVLLINAPDEADVASLLVAEDAFAMTDDKVATALRAALDRVAPRLPTPEPITLAPEGFEIRAEAFRVVQAFQVWQTYGAWIEAHAPDFGPGIKDRIAFAATVTPEQYEEALTACDTMRDAIRAMIPPGTVVALPTAPCIAPPVDSSDADLVAFRSRAMGLTSTGGISGLPQVSLPLADVDGCPVGLSFLGWAGGDEALLDLAVRIAS